MPGTEEVGSTAEKSESGEVVNLPPKRNSCERAVTEDVSTPGR